MLSFAPRYFRHRIGHVGPALEAVRGGKPMPFGARKQATTSATKLLAVVLLATSATGADPANDLTAALDDIYREQNIQRQLPVAPMTPGDPPRQDWAIPGEFGWLVLAVAAVGVAALALWMVGFDVVAASAKRRRRRAQQDLDGASPDPETPVPADWLRTADDLARQGRFAEAIHLLLLGVLGKLPAVGQMSGAQTAREIARTHVGPNPERLRALVQTSELVHFGGRPATREQFEHCRRDALEFDGAGSPAPA